MRISASLLVLSSVLVACGGGGGDAPPAPLPVATPLTLTAANYVAVAQESLSASTYLVDSASLVTGAQVSDTDVLVKFGKAQAAKLPTWLSNSPAQVTGAVQSNTENCAGGGTMSITETDVNGNKQADAGDSVSLTASNCGFEGSVFNGGLLLTINSLTGNLEVAPYNASVTLAFGNLSAKSSSSTTTGNGSIVLTINARTSTDQSFALNTASFESSSIYGGATYSRKLTDYTVSVDLRSGSSSTKVDGTLASSAFESKSVTVSTSPAFVRSTSQAYPASGQATAIGANGGMVRITAINSTSVNIELDADANGIFETSVTKLWTELL